MNDKPLAGRKVAIMLANGFDEVEFTEPQKRLLALGAATRVASRENGLVNGWHGDAWGHFFPIDEDLAKTLAVDYHGLVVPGGWRNVDKLAEDPHAKRVLKAFLRAGMPVMLVGDAVQLLDTVELARGRSVTSSDRAREALVAAGASWDEQPHVVEGTLITVRDESGLGDAITAFATQLESAEDGVTQAA